MIPRLNSLPLNNNTSSGDAYLDNELSKLLTIIIAMKKWLVTLFAVHFKPCFHYITIKIYTLFRFLLIILQLLNRLTRRNHLLLQTLGGSLTSEHLIRIWPSISEALRSSFTAVQCLIILLHIQFIWFSLS